MTSEFAGWRPAAPLRPFAAWYVGYLEYGIPPGVHRGLPSPYLTLIFTLDEPLTVAAHPDPRTPPGQYDALVGGLHSAPALIRHDGRQAGIQIAISPLGARALLGLPAGELANADLPAADLLGSFAEEVRERLMAADGWPRRFAVLDGLLSRRLAEGPGRVPAEVTHGWRRLLATGGTLTVPELAREVGWSPRYLSRRFGEEIGLTPKLAARVVRFDRARRLLQQRAATGPAGTLATLAADTGYYDQAHLAREFGQFAGCAPSRWLREEFRIVQAGEPVRLSDSAT